MKKSWPTEQLVNLCEMFADGDWIESKDQSVDGIRLIQTGNVGEGVFKSRDDKARYISEATFKRLRCTEIFESDCLVSRLPEPAGRSCILPDTGERMITSVDCTIVRFNTQKVIPAFFNFYTQSREYLKAINSQTTGTTRKRISKSKLGEVLIPVPPLSEQQRIVAILDEAFDGIAAAKSNAGKNAQNARALFESHLQSVFAARGEGQVEKRLDEISTFSSGGTPSKTNVGYWNGDIPWVSGRDMKSTWLSDSFLHISQSAVDESSTRLAPAGTLLVLVRGMGLAHGAQITELMVPCAFNQDIKGIHANPSVIPRYLLFALRNRINSSDSVLSNAAHGTLKINSDELRKLRIPVPPLNDQQKAVNAIDLLAAETQRLESIYKKKLAALDELKQSLLHQAFSGQL